MHGTLQPGTLILSPAGAPLTIDPELAAAWQPGDRLVATPQGELLHINAAVSALVTTAVDPR